MFKGIDWKGTIGFAFMVAGLFILSSFFIAMFIYYVKIFLTVGFVAGMSLIVVGAILIFIGYLLMLEKEDNEMG